MAQIDRPALTPLTALVALLRAVRVDWAPAAHGVALEFRPTIAGGTLKGVRRLLPREGWQGWSDFPQYGQAPMTPMRQTTLAATRSSTAADRALLVRFAQWLHRPAQQELLAAAAIPPVAAAPSLQERWQLSPAVTDTHQGALFALNHLTNPFGGLALPMRNDLRLGKAVQYAAQRMQDLTAALGDQGITVL